MCLAVIYWQPDQNTPLKVVANRDEFRERASQPMHWWPQEDILAGRDLVAGGSWLGFSRQHRFALLTNIRPGYVGVSRDKSRGELVTQFLTQPSLSIEEYRDQVAREIDSYAGFNLILGEKDSLFWFSSTNPTGQNLAPGIHALSNDSLNTPWPKAILAKQQMQKMHMQMDIELSNHEILTSSQPAQNHQLPQTGIPLDWEKRLSAQTIHGKDYGTRCRTHFVQNTNGSMRVAEQQIDIDGKVNKEVIFSF